jgi:RHS repeat-associated protein
VGDLLEHPTPQGRVGQNLWAHPARSPFAFAFPPGGSRTVYYNYPSSAIGDCTDAKTGADPAQNTGDEHLYYTQDANFNVTALVDDYDGAVVERYMYSPYGEVTVLHGVRDSSGTDTSADEWSERTSNTFENALLYCGYYHDSETGLYQGACPERSRRVRHRYYHPTFGRWTSRDRIGYADGPSLYCYVGSQPNSSTDPLGTSSQYNIDATAKLRSQIPPLHLAHKVDVVTLRAKMEFECSDTGEITPHSASITKQIHEPSVIDRVREGIWSEMRDGKKALLVYWEDAGAVAYDDGGEFAPTFGSLALSWVPFVGSLSGYVVGEACAQFDWIIDWEFSMKWRVECICLEPEEGVR